MRFRFALFTALCILLSLTSTSVANTNDPYGCIPSDLPDKILDQINKKYKISENLPPNTKDEYDYSQATKLIANILRGVIDKNTDSSYTAAMKFDGDFHIEDLGDLITHTFGYGWFYGSISKNKELIGIAIFDKNKRENDIIKITKPFGKFFHNFKEMDGSLIHGKKASLISTSHPQIKIGSYSFESVIIILDNRYLDSYFKVNQEESIKGIMPNDLRENINHLETFLSQIRENPEKTDRWRELGDKYDYIIKKIKPNKEEVPEINLFGVELFNHIRSMQAALMSVGNIYYESDKIFFDRTNKILANIKRKDLEDVIFKTSILDAKTEIEGMTKKSIAEAFSSEKPNKKFDKVRLEIITKKGEEDNWRDNITVDQFNISNCYIKAPVSITGIVCIGNERSQFKIKGDATLLSSYGKLFNDKFNPEQVQALTEVNTVFCNGNKEHDSKYLGQILFLAYVED